MAVEKKIVALGARIRAIREEKGLTQTDLAIKADLNISTIQRVEAGKYAAGVDVIFLLAEAMGVRVVELFR